MKPNWACGTCGMYSSRKYSVQRHIKNLHKGRGYLLSFVDYLVGRQMGYYHWNSKPTYQKTKPDYSAIVEEEVWRERARINVRNNMKFQN